MFAVFVPLGPDPRELDRLRDTLASLLAFEDGNEMHLVIVDDDGGTGRALPIESDYWSGVTVIPLQVPSGEARNRAYDAMVIGTVEALIAVAPHRPEFVLKLDTDALVIGPFSDRLREVFADPGLGVVGSYRHTCTGAPRDWSHWETALRRAARPLAIGRDFRPLRRSRGAWRGLRSILRQAVSNGYELGAHCLGGAYAVGPGLLAATQLLDWRPWVATGLGEDVMVGALAKAAGMEIRGLVEPGEPFGLAWQGLPLAPEQLLERRYSVIHSVKDQGYGTESQLRAFFRERRPSDTLRGSAGLA
jgi:hypothetical protein